MSDAPKATDGGERLDGQDLRLLEKLGIRSEFKGGLRVTDEETMEVVEMVLSGPINKSIVRAINQAGGKAVGLSGSDGKSPAKGVRKTCSSLNRSLGCADARRIESSAMPSGLSPPGLVADSPTTGTFGSAPRRKSTTS